MLPNSDTYDLDDELDEEFEEEVIPNKTFKLNFEKKIIEGVVDGDEAKKQAIQKILITESEEYPIYGFGYGIMVNDLIGEDMIYVRSELKDRIVEAILYDDRFEAVEFTDEVVEKRKIILSFTVICSDGNEIEMEGVEIDV